VAAAGAKRISVGGALNRLALAAFVDAARAMKEDGSFAWMQRIADMGSVRKLFAAAG
jgi:2-methylisocitrate lyase-like PEP mutase family enzyme